MSHDWSQKWCDAAYYRQEYVSPMQHLAGLQGNRCNREVEM